MNIELVRERIESEYRLSKDLQFFFKYLISEEANYNEETQNKLNFEITKESVLERNLELINENNYWEIYKELVKQRYL